MSLVVTSPEETTDRVIPWCHSAPISPTEGTVPDWYQELRKAAWTRFANIPVPVRTNEKWRFSDLQHLRFDDYTLASKLPSDLTSELINRAISERPEHFSAHFVFANGQLIHAETPALPESAVCVPLSDAFHSHPEQLREHFLKHEDFVGGDKFAALHASATLSGTFIYLPKATVIEHAILIHHFVGGANSMIFPHTLIVADQNSKVSVTEAFESVAENEETLVVGIADLHADHGGKIQYVALQDLSESGAKHVQLQHARAGRDAAIKIGYVNLGAEWVRNESINRMVEEGADCQVFSANLANRDQEFDQRTLQSHEAQHTTSDLYFKNALYDRSRTIFSGLIQVHPNAHYTDSYQSCRNLMGSEEAESNSLPGLEIDADQVKCSHGATSGTISEDEIFYLQSRGLPAEEARRMITLGFLNESIQRLEGDDLKTTLVERIERKFHSLS